MVKGNSVPKLGLRVGGDGLVGHGRLWLELPRFSDTISPPNRVNLNSPTGQYNHHTLPETPAELVDAH